MFVALCIECADEFNPTEVSDNEFCSFQCYDLTALREEQELEYKALGTVTRGLNTRQS